MTRATQRQAMVERLLDAAREDPRIVGLLDYGSSSEGRLDEWSDIDVAVFVRDADFELFEANWNTWAAQFGDLLLAYRGVVGHPWTVYDTQPVPLRVDFDLHPAAAISRVETWPNSPTSVESMLWYDGSDGKLREVAGRLVGKSLAPDNPQEDFERLAGDLFYYLLFCYARLRRSEDWVARQTFHVMVMESLLRLLRMEAGAYDRWQGSRASQDIERVTSPERLVQLDACIPGSELEPVLVAALTLGREVCLNLELRHGWPWPAALADRIGDLLDDGSGL